MESTRRLLAGSLVLVVVNFLWLSNGVNHFKVGMVWLVVDVLLWLPELKVLSAKL